MTGHASARESSYEVFCDAGYFDNWCVSEKGETRFGAGCPAFVEAKP